MLIRVLFFVVVSAIICSVRGQEPICPMPDGGVGICRPIVNCPELLKMANSYRTAPLAQRPLINAFLGARRCEPTAPVWKVCCSDCQTPDKISGVIKNIRHCPHLFRMLNDRTPEGRIYVGQSRVDQATLNVCCGPALSDCDIATTAQPPNVNGRCCGIDSNTNPRIIGGNTTEIGEYPWTVLLEEEVTMIGGKKTMKMSCGGSLISKRYVVTAAHCIPSNKLSRLLYVRVGEHDTGNPGRDCKILADGSPDCTDGHFSNPIETIIRHPEYDYVTSFNDIALIRLKYPVRHTDFVRPICLPTRNLWEGTELTVVGWGRVNETHVSRFKQAVGVPFVNAKECQDAYLQRALGYRKDLWAKQMCAGGSAGKDSCSGDSGGPLMAKVESSEIHYELAGVVSFGPQKCGQRGSPGVYTNVYQYLDWIQQNIYE